MSTYLENQALPNNKKITHYTLLQEKIQWPISGEAYYRKTWCTKFQIQ
jgi:hypothetical protein